MGAQVDKMSLEVALEEAIVMATRSLQSFLALSERASAWRMVEESLSTPDCSQSLLTPSEVD